VLLLSELHVLQSRILADNFIVLSARSNDCLSEYNRAFCIACLGTDGAAEKESKSRKNNVGKNKLLWMIGEIGEVIDIIKKNGDQVACASDGEREHLVEEMADVLMYYNDILLCYGITADELKKVYTDKFHKNMTRW